MFDIAATAITVDRTGTKFAFRPRMQPRYWFISWLFTQGCADIETVELTHYRRVCPNVGPYPCAFDPHTDRGYALSAIEGFQHEWGHEYQLRVAVTDIGDPDEDGPRSRYELVEIVSNEIAPPDSTFEFSMVRYPFPNYPEGTIARGELFDGTPFIYATSSLQEELDVAIANHDRRFAMTFGYSPGTTLPLIARSITYLD